jgi:3-aminobutyryl-CoA ammonia-lyase
MYSFKNYALNALNIFQCIFYFDRGHQARGDASPYIIGGVLMKVLIRVRMSAHDAHYGGNLVDGARMLQLFGDVATELLIRSDGDEGLFRAYDNVEFLAPVYAGDFIEAEGEIVSTGKTSRKMTFEARKVSFQGPI